MEILQNGKGLKISSCGRVYSIHSAQTLYFFNAQTMQTDAFHRHRLLHPIIRPYGYMKANSCPDLYFPMVDHFSSENSASFSSCFFKMA